VSDDINFASEEVPNGASTVLARPPR